MTIDSSSAQRSTDAGSALNRGSKRTVPTSNGGECASQKSGISLQRED